MARERHVYPTSEIAHLWAHQSKPDARNSQGNFYFQGDTIYSYGSHFPIARHIEHDGKKAILFVDHSYSNTTSKHIGNVRHSIPPGVPVFEVSDVRRNPGSLAKAYNKLESDIIDLNRFADFFGGKAMLLPSDLNYLTEIAHRSMWGGL